MANMMVSKSKCGCGSCRGCKGQGHLRQPSIKEFFSAGMPVEESVSMEESAVDSVAVGQEVKQVAELPVVERNTDDRWWPPDWKRYLSERMLPMADNIYPHPTIEGSYKSIKDKSTLMIRETEHGVGVFVDLTPEAVLNPSYTTSGRRETLRGRQVLEGVVAYEEDTVIAEYKGVLQHGALPSKEVYTFETTAGQRVRAPSSDQ